MSEGRKLRESDGGGGGGGGRGSTLFRSHFWNFLSALGCFFQTFICSNSIFIHSVGHNFSFSFYSRAKN